MKGCTSIFARDGGVADSFNNKKLTFIANISIRSWMQVGNALMMVEESPITFQFIGLEVTEGFLDSGKSFGKTVVSGFDLTCVQFYIDTPELPCLVKAYSQDALDLLARKQFMMHAFTYRSNEILWKRISKYMDRGLMFVGLDLAEFETSCCKIVFENCRMVGHESRVMHSGDCKFLSKMLGVISHNADIVSRASPGFCSHNKKVKLTLLGLPKHHQLLADGNSVLPKFVRNAMKDFVEATLLPHGDGIEKDMPQKVKNRLALMKVVGTRLSELRRECHLPASACYLFKFEEGARDFSYKDGHFYLLKKEGLYLVQI